MKGSTEPLRKAHKSIPFKVQGRSQQMLRGYNLVQKSIAQLHAKSDLKFLSLLSVRYKWQVCLQHEHTHLN